MNVENSTRPLPVTILTGFLGSGKTTLLNHLLGNMDGIRAAVLVNEFGEIGIDNELIISTDNDMVELSNGCICCSINEDLVRTVARILERRDEIDYLLVETTGIADPLPVALTFVGRYLSENTRLDSIISLVDVNNYPLDTIESTAAYNQIKHGDIILLNKTDLVDDLTILSIEQKIRDIKPAARIIHTEYAALPLPLLLDIDLHTSASYKRLDQSYKHAHEEHFVSVTFRDDRPFDPIKLQNFLGHHLPTSVLRGKGFLRFKGHKETFLFHLCGRRFTMEKCDPDKSGKANRLVFIGQNLDRPEIINGLTESLVGADRISPHNTSPTRTIRKELINQPDR